VSVIEGRWGQQPNVATELLERSFEHRLRHVGLPFLRQLLHLPYHQEEEEDVPRRGVKLLQWIHDQDVFPRHQHQAGEEELNLSLDVKEALEAAADPLYDDDVIPDAAYALSALILLVACLVDRWPHSITAFPMVHGGSLNFRDHGTRTLLVDGSAELRLLDQARQPVVPDVVKLLEEENMDIAGFLAAFLDADDQLSDPIVSYTLNRAFMFVLAREASSS
jgi:hypothetical protein